MLPHVQKGERKMIDYIAMMQEYYGTRNDGFITDLPKTIQLAEDDYVRVKYDSERMEWIPSRPSRIKYPTAKELIKEYRREFAEKLDGRA
jgi:hypothetical protein